MGRSDKKNSYHNLNFGNLREGERGREVQKVFLEIGAPNQSKKVKNTLDFSVLCFLINLLSLKTDLIVHTVINRQI